MKKMCSGKWKKEKGKTKGKKKNHKNGPVWASYWEQYAPWVMLADPVPIRGVSSVAFGSEPLNAGRRMTGGGGAGGGKGGLGL